MLEQLYALGYHPKWLDYGLIHHDELAHQYEWIQKTQRSFSNAKYYRLHAFSLILEQHDYPIDTEIVEQYLELVEYELEYAVRHLALQQLFACPSLTDTQLIMLRTHPACASAEAQYYLRRRWCIQEMYTRLLTAERIAFYIATDDLAIQRELVEMMALNVSQLLALYTRGSGQTVRNLAREKLWRQLNHTERQRLFGASQSDKAW